MWQWGDMSIFSKQKQDESIVGHNYRWLWAANRNKALFMDDITCQSMKIRQEGNNHFTCTLINWSPLIHYKIDYVLFLVFHLTLHVTLKIDYDILTVISCSLIIPRKTIISFVLNVHMELISLVFSSNSCS